MASSETTPIAAITSSQPPTAQDETSSLSKLSPELRNKIYEYTFTTARETGLVPHALTQANTQFRKESLSMYYASIELLTIPLRTLEQIRRTKKWLAEVDWSFIPVLPDLVLLSRSPTLHFDISITCVREEIAPIDELSSVLAVYAEFAEEGWSDPDTHENALKDTYVHCLGFGADSCASIRDGPVPDYFKQAVENGGTWVTRQWFHEVHGDRDYVGAERNLFDMFVKNAVHKQGLDWDSSDLKRIVGWFEHNKYHEPC